MRQLTLSLLAALICYGTRSFAEEVDVKAWRFGGETKASTLKIFDIAEQMGEETMTWLENSKSRVIKVSDSTADSYVGDYLIRNRRGETLEDLSLSASFNGSYLQTLELLKEESFRAGFAYVEDKCSPEDNGYLIITNNENGEMKGYCLLPKKD